MEETKKKIYCPTALRGFQKHLLKRLEKQYEIKVNENLFFEKITLKKKLISKLIRSKLGDLFGIIYTLKVRENCDLVFSYNRFIRGKKYIINLENPTALYHYSLKRNTSLLGKRKLKNKLNDIKLKKIVCISKACYNTASELLNNEVNINKLIQVYPYIEDKKIDIKILERKCLREKVNLLFISSDFYLKGGKEILETMKKLYNKSINLTIITQKKNIKKEDLMEIKRDERIKILEFNLKFDELEEIYNDANILLHPTRQDSSPMVILESIKFGLPCLGTSIYAIPEMIENNVNGFLIQPKFLFFDKNNKPNPKVWNNRKKTIYSEYCDYKVVDFLIEKISLYNEDRKLLISHSKNSYFKSINEEFSSENIIKTWEGILKNEI